MLVATPEYRISHIGSTLSALDGQLSQAQQLIFELHNRQQTMMDEKPISLVQIWSQTSAFRNQIFATEADVDRAFDNEKENIKQMIRMGKTVRVA